ncbi:hypothetical protein OAK44_00760 [bacterium]|nr:hypothetical protein [Verrucomicrobiales bacterium]MDB3941049.1 hypothetical protein [Verrucomicrobiales bacterium]MDC0252327.1 hypothetical protein [bacterium]
MPKKRLFTWIGLILLAAFLVSGFLEILERRFADGDVYPHYASFRSDPLGTSALYESFDRIDSLSVRRNIRHLNTIKDVDADSTLLLIGYPRDNFRNLRAPENSAVMKAVEDGARLVITANPGLVPERFLPTKTEEEEDWFDRRRKLREERNRKRGHPGKEDKADEDEEEKAEDEVEEEFETRMDEALGMRLTKKLGFQIESLENFERPDGGWELKAGRTVSGEKMKGELPTWYSQFRFEELSHEWAKVVVAEGGPVVIERNFGKGTVVIASDSFFVSNEALHLEPTPGFLEWIVGGKSKIIFDETIHGSTESGGAMKLIRRYRLHGVFFGLLVFVFLWAWRSASPLAPGSEELDLGLVGGGGTVAGEDTGSGFVRLLRGSVPPKQLIERCLAIRRESVTTEPQPEAAKAMDAIFARHQADPKKYGIVQAYREISGALRRVVGGTLTRDRKSPK